MFGYHTPRSYTEALESDKAKTIENGVFQKHEKAKFARHRKVINSSPGYQIIRVNLIFAVKYDGRQARLVADG